MIKLKIQCLLGILFKISFSFAGIKEQQAIKIMQDFSQNYMKPQGFFLSGIGSSIPNQIHQVSVHYISPQHITINQVRKIFINSVQNLICLINQNKKIRPYLVYYPFNEKNIKLSLAFENKSKYYDPPYIAFVFLVKNKIYYNYYDNQKKKFTDAHEETYQEALEIVRGTKLNQ